jgi:tRNA U34 5-methylaminomethyl-2-thiouridine-forming methyltransferase MnmC
MVQKCLTLSYLYDLLRRERVQNPGHNMAAGARHFRHGVISVIFAGVSVTSRFRRRHLPRVIRDSVISVILAGVILTSRK